MAEISKTKNAVELVQEINNKGVIVEYIEVEGNRIGILGSLNEADRNAALDVLNKAYESSGGDIMEMISALSTVATCTEKDISPDEMVNVNGIDFMISYSNWKAYTMEGEEIANCEDLKTESGILNDIPDEAIKNVLVDRIKLALPRYDESDYGYDDEDLDAVVCEIWR